MKRRTLILGGGALATLSLGATATNASLSGVVESAANFQVIEESDIIVSLTPNPASAGAESIHTWEIDKFASQDDIDKIVADYDFGSNGAGFGPLDNGNITVEFEQNNNNDNLKNITINQDSYSGTTATIDLDNRFDRTINDRAIVTIGDDTAGIQNPSAGTYEPTLTFITDSGKEATFSTELETTDTGEAFFAVDITSAPDVVSAGTSFDTDFEVSNTGNGTTTQTVTGSIDSTEVYSDSFTLAPDASRTDTFGYTTSDADAPEIDVIVNSDDNTGAKTITIADAFDLTLDPPKQKEKNSVHTWEAGYVNFDGEVDTITVDYTTGGNQDPSLDGLTQSDITVVMTRQLSSGKDTSEIDVNDDTYSGAVDTFDLSGIFNTDLAGSLTVTIGDSSAGTGVENPKKGTYDATITLDGPNDTLTETVSYEVG
jgi:hypothetical protein